MKKEELLQLMQLQSELASKAMLLNESGIVRSVTIKTDINSIDSFEVSVILNAYRNDEMRWQAVKLDYGADQEAHLDEKNAEAMLQYLNAEITALDERSKNIIARIADIINMFSKK